MRAANLFPKIFEPYFPARSIFIRDGNSFRSAGNLRLSGLEFALQHCATGGFMETIAGVFRSMTAAEQAVKELRERNMPEQSIVFLSSGEPRSGDIHRTSPSEMVGNSSGNPPASHTPRFTASATWRR